MTHFFYIDPLEKLNQKKDSSLMLAATLMDQGQSVRFIFEKDLSWSNSPTELNCHRFKISWSTEKKFYLKDVQNEGVERLTPQAGDIFHMRLDPPFDGRYLRYLWLLDQWERQGVRVINSPRGIMQFNEKLLAFQQRSSVPSWVGEDPAAFKDFCSRLSQKGEDQLILKPLDLYSGIGVEKWALSDPKLPARFKEKVAELRGPVVAQPFMKEVLKGEIRAMYFKGEHLGSILKLPKDGEFISNIAQGATFKAIELPASVHAKCLTICAELTQEGVSWVAFDILGETVTEANITCPGLLTEVSHAHGKNLGLRMIELLG